MALTPEELKRQRARHKGSGGSSEENRNAGFRPAFMDVDSHLVFQSLTAEGQPAPVHVLDGLPEHLIVERDEDGLVTRIREQVVAGFLRDGQFYTRDEAARLTSLESARMVANYDSSA